MIRDGKAAYAQYKAQRPEKAASMFRGGRDTLTISRKFAISEPTILRWITNERCQRLNLPNPYSQA